METPAAARQSLKKKIQNEMPESLEFQREENSLLPRRHMDVKWWMKHTAVLELNHWIRKKRLRCFPGGWCFIECFHVRAPYVWLF